MSCPVIQTASVATDTNPLASESLRTTRQTSLSVKLGLSSLALMLAPVWAQAYTVGHAQVQSASGAPLVVSIPLRKLSSADLANIAVKVAPLEQWTASGLKPPVALESLSVQIAPADVVDATQRKILVQSTQSAQGGVVDILLEVTTTSGVKPVQASVIVVPAAVVQAPSGQAISIQRGDTLWTIARQYPTEGATIYQTLVALYQANPQAFINQNMNLMRTGASLKLPSAADVLAINPAAAQQFFNQQLQAFNAMRGARAAASVQALKQAPEQANKGQVEPKVEQASSAGNEVKLSPPNASSPSAQADQATSVSRQINDEKARVEALQASKNGSNASNTPNAPSGSPANSANSTQPAGVNAATDKATAANNATPSTSSLEGGADVVNTVRKWFVENTFIAAVIVLALLTWIIAFFMKSAASRREEEQSAKSMLTAAQQAELDKKLSSIDLDLDQPPKSP